MAERLRREHDHSFGGPWGLNGPAAGDAGTSATLTALLETKDARILSLEREVALLEGEVAMARESGGAGLGGVLVGGGLAGSRWGSRASLVTPPPTDDSRLLQVLQERERKAKSQVSRGCLGCDVTRCRQTAHCSASSAPARVPRPLRVIVSIRSCQGYVRLPQKCVEDGSRASWLQQRGAWRPCVAV